MLSSRKRIWVPILMGAAAGMLGGLMGIGAGVILVPMMVTFLGITQHEAHGTSLAVMPLIGLVGATQYALLGHANWALVATLAVGGIIGVVVGAKLMMKVPATRLRQGFGILLLLAALHMLTRQV